MVAAAWLVVWVLTRSSRTAAETSGTSPLITTTAPLSGSSGRAATTAPPVPFGSGCTAVAVPSGSAPSRLIPGDVTTTTAVAPAPLAASTGQATSGRPQRSCSTFGTAERMRVPWPAAMTTAVKEVTGGRLEAAGVVRGAAQCASAIHGEWCNGSTGRFGRSSRGSNPCSPAPVHPRQLERERAREAGGAAPPEERSEAKREAA